jgi:hypothetical protein
VLFDQHRRGVDIRNVRRHDEREKAETGLLLQPGIPKRGPCEAMG